MSREYNIPKVIYLYVERIKELDFNCLSNFVANNFGNIKFCLIKLKEEVVCLKGLLFDFLNTKKAFERIKSAKEKTSCHIIITDKLFATLGDDKRPHIRSSIYGFPSVVSTSGIIEGPARPKEFYLYKQKYMQLGIWNIEGPKIEKKLRNQFIDYQDKRMNKVLKGYIAQALFFYITGEPFCAQKSCRLFNAHWQKDLIYAQIKIGKFCAVHNKVLQRIKENVGGKDGQKTDLSRP